MCRVSVKADFPAGVTAPIQYGSSVIAQIGYFSVYQYIPFRRLKDLFSQVFGLPISEGSMANLLEKDSKKCEVVYAEIKNQIAPPK